MQERGAYVLHLQVQRPAQVSAGSFGAVLVPAGHYLYVGSALKGIPVRIARHRRLAEQKTGKLHWHIDYLLTHPDVRLIGEAAYPGRRECEISRVIGSAKGVRAPLPRFGSSDCHSGCRAHLYRSDMNSRETELFIRSLNSKNQAHQRTGSQNSRMTYYDF